MSCKFLYDYSVVGLGRSVTIVSVMCVEARVFKDVLANKGWKCSVYSLLYTICVSLCVNVSPYYVLFKRHVLIFWYTLIRNREINDLQTFFVVNVI